MGFERFNSTKIICRIESDNFVVVAAGGSGGGDLHVSSFSAIKNDNEYF